MWARAKEIEVRKIGNAEMPAAKSNSGSPADKAVSVKSLPREHPAISAQVNSQEERGHKVDFLYLHCSGSLTVQLKN